MAKICYLAFFVVLYPTIKRGDSMTPYHNPRVFLANLVKFEYNKEQRKYIPLILNAKIPVVLIPGYGYYTDKIDTYMPLSIVDVNNYNHVRTNKFYITNVRSIERYTDEPNKLLSNWFVSSLKLNEVFGFDGKWYTKEELRMDKPEYKSVLYEPDMKLDETLYVAKLASKIKKIQNYEGMLVKDIYLHISNNYGLFSYDEHGFKSKLTGYHYDELKYNNLKDVVLSFDIDREYCTTPMYQKEELGLTHIYDLHEFISTFRLYIDPKKDILTQINSYEDLQTNINYRTLGDLRGYDDSINLTNYKRERLNKDIIKRTLSKR